jgi:hypothetical protein
MNSYRFASITRNRMYCVRRILNGAGHSSISQTVKKIRREQFIEKCKKKNIYGPADASEAKLHKRLKGEGTLQ